MHAATGTNNLMQYIIININQNYYKSCPSTWPYGMHLNSPLPQHLPSCGPCQAECLVRSEPRVRCSLLAPAKQGRQASTAGLDSIATANREGEQQGPWNARAKGACNEWEEAWLVRQHRLITQKKHDRPLSQMDNVDRTCNAFNTRASFQAILVQTHMSHHIISCHYISYHINHIYIYSL